MPASYWRISDLLRVYMLEIVTWLTHETLSRSNRLSISNSLQRILLRSLARCEIADQAFAKRTFALSISHRRCEAKVARIFSSSLCPSLLPCVSFFLILIVVTTTVNLEGRRKAKDPEWKLAQRRGRMKREEKFRTKTGHDEDSRTVGVETVGKT